MSHTKAWSIVLHLPSKKISFLNTAYTHTHTHTPTERVFLSAQLWLRIQLKSRLSPYVDIIHIQSIIDASRLALLYYSQHIHQLLCSYVRWIVCFLLGALLCSVPKICLLNILYSSCTICTPTDSCRNIYTDRKFCPYQHHVNYVAMGLVTEKGENKENIWLALTDFIRGSESRNTQYYLTKFF